jgi:multiple sugar transport system ATP-binding protein
VLVGPSGCGKSTFLRMIAGLEDATSGEIFIDGKRVNDVPPKDRDIAMVFQNYALYPHMTVVDNMSFGLKLRKHPRPEIEERVAEAARILGIEELLDRRPKALSGGQRQRVALGRAIVRKPKVFLFDEPLSNLDAKLRVQMRAELLKLHQELQSTVIYVTHDQVEALTMGELIVILKDGITQQVADPLTLYNRPANLFVAGFIGSPSMNFFRGRIEHQDGLCFVKDELQLRLPDFPALATWTGREVVLGIRPEDIHAASSESEQRLRATVGVVEPIGEAIYVHLRIGAQTVVARFPPVSPPRFGDTIGLRVDLEKAHFFDPESEKRIEQNGVREQKLRGT